MVIPAVNYLWAVFVFWINPSRETEREQVDEDRMIIKPFTSNYKRDIVFKKGLLPAHGFRTVSAIVLIGFTL
jgi:hypothetical protein